MRRRSCSLLQILATLRLDCFDAFHQCLVLSVYFHVAHVLKCDLLGPAVQELELLRLVLAEFALETGQLRLVDPPGTLDFPVEAELVADGDGSEHSIVIYGKYIVYTHHK